MNYSIRYLNDKGVTERSEFLPFASDADATDHARTHSQRHFILEVWKGEDLLLRSFRDEPTN